MVEEFISNIKSRQRNERGERNVFCLKSEDDVFAITPGRNSIFKEDLENYLKAN
jgi:hypothetical protein